MAETTNIKSEEVGFVHSVRVPRLYKAASKALRMVEEFTEGLKNAIHSCKHPNVKALTALVSEAIRHRQLMDVLIMKSKLKEKEPRLDIYLVKILITELLWGKKRLGGNSKPVQTILTYKDKLEKIMERYFRQNKSEKNSSSDMTNSQLVRKPRYVRVNSLNKKLDEVINILNLDGWNQVDQTDSEYLDIYDFFIDPFVENLLVFRSGTEFHHNPLYLEGTLILQDKASCLAALALKPRRGKVVLDACAAPGMKTSHLAALMQNEGTIYACEKNSKRCETLTSMIESLNVNCVSVLSKDFTDIDPSTHPDVEYILLDPSCSGSGMYNRINETQSNLLENTASQKDRLMALSFYQSKLLMHAMKFPNVKKIVYSTCSVHSEENEDVIAYSLEQSESQVQFRVKTVLRSWPHRSENPNYNWSSCCVRCDFETDRTDGFFIALLEKIKIK